MRAATGCRVAVNLFPPTLADLDLPARLDDALGRQGLTPAALAVEITEDFLLGNLDRARFVLDGLHRLGITIAIDDFGSGNSSLNHLRHLPIDEVKLDRSFKCVDHRGPARRSDSAVGHRLVRTLGLTTVAEGVENSATAAMLTGYGCDIAQGHHYCQPLTAAQTLDLTKSPTQLLTRAEWLPDFARSKAGSRSQIARRECVAQHHSANHRRNAGKPARHEPTCKTQTGTNSTPASATASSRSGAVTTARKPSPSFQTLAFRVSPGNTTPANRAP